MKSRKLPPLQHSALRPLTCGSSHFFGFHDLTPWNLQTQELVCLRTNVAEDHVPTSEDVAEVVVLNEETNAQTAIGRTRAWNWQMAARQRWLPALGKRIVAYNAENSMGFECRLVDLDKSETRILPVPLYDICGQAGFGLTLNFRRLVLCQPGYGYDHPRAAPTTDYERDGIFRVDFSNGKPDLILSIAHFLKSRGMDTRMGEHYFTHIQAAPNAKQFAFIHRCRLSSGGMVNHLVVADSDGGNMRVLHGDKVSHFDWCNDGQVVVWCRKSATIRRIKESKLLFASRVLYRLSKSLSGGRLRQSLYNECFRKISVSSLHAVDVGKGILTEDGHPQVNPCCPTLWVNDTYPDARGFMTLMLYDEITNSRYDLLRIPSRSAIRGTDWRCDLHPRWDPQGRRVCVDSSHLGRRQLCLVDVENAIHALKATC